MPAYFKGSETHSLDSKFRFALPAKMAKQVNEAINGKFVITRGFEDCIILVPIDEWETFMTNLQSLSMFDEDARWMANSINMYMDDQQWDAQHRFTLSPQLIKLAGIKDKVRIVGMINHFALWDPDAHDKYMEEMESKRPYKTVAQEVFRKPAQ